MDVWSGWRQRRIILPPPLTLKVDHRRTMDVFNRQPVISEDTLHYTLYPPPGSSDKASVTTFAACIQTYVESLLPDFLWHRDSFELKVVSDPDNQNWMLEGTMRVGDCVDDEWCTVWLLREVSAKWDSAIRYVIYCFGDINS